MIKVMFRKANEKYPKLYRVISCMSSISGGGGRQEKIFGVCMGVSRIYPKQQQWDAMGIPVIPDIETVWINDYGDITQVTYNSRDYDFKKEHDAEMFYNAIRTELALEELEG